MFLSYSTLLPQKYTDEDLSCGVLPSRQHLWYAIYTEGVAPGYYLVVPSRHRSASRMLVMYPSYPWQGKKKVLQAALPQEHI